MSFGIVRMRTISAGAAGEVEKHNAREYSDKEFEKHKNINRNYDNFLGPNSHYKKDDLKLEDAINQRIKESGAKIRKNSAVAIEFVLALSPDVKKLYEDDNGYSASGMLSNLDQFIIEKFGEDNVLSISHHLDESNPHSHIVVIPIKKKEIKWKNRSGAGSRIENRLVARDYIGTKQKLRTLQTDFYNHVKKWEDALPGITFYRGVDARKRKREYTKHTRHELAEVREIMEELKKMPKSEEKDVKIENLQSRLKQNIEKTKKPKIFKDVDNLKSKKTFERFNPFKKENIDKGMGM